MTDTSKTIEEKLIEADVEVSASGLSITIDTDGHITWRDIYHVEVENT